MRTRNQANTQQSNPQPANGPYVLWEESLTHVILLLCFDLSFVFRKHPSPIPTGDHSKCTPNRQISFKGRNRGGMLEMVGGSIPESSLDEYVIMLNHLHGVIRFHQGRRGGSRTAPTQRGRSPKHLIGALKTVSTKHTNQLERTPGKVRRQRGYYGHISREETDPSRIRRYIRQNSFVTRTDN